MLMFDTFVDGVIGYISEIKLLVKTQLRICM